MAKFIATLHDNDNSLSYINNISPLLWTNDIEKAKIFFSKSEVISDLSFHSDLLLKLLENKENGRYLEIVQLE